MRHFLSRFSAAASPSVRHGPLRRPHVFYDCSHGSNLKLLTIQGLIDACITKVREVTKISNFLGPLRKCTLFGFVTVSL